MTQAENKTISKNAIIPLELFLKIFDKFQKLGFDKQAMLKFTNATEDILKQNGCVTKYSRLLSLYQAVFTLSSDPALGLKIGKKMHLGVYGVLGYAMMSTPTY